MNKKMVLACIDGSALSDAVCDYAAWIAERIDVPLKLLHTIDHHHETAATTDLSGNLGVNSRDHLLEEMSDLEHVKSKARIRLGKSILQEASDRVIEMGISTSINCLQHGSLVESLTEFEDDISIFVLGARGKIHEDQSNQIGAKLEAMIRSLHRPILVANQAFKTPRRIMIAYDGGEAAENAVDMVADSPLYKGLVCHLVCVDKKGVAENLLDKAAHRLGAAGGIDVVSAHLQGKVEHKLCEYQLSHHIDVTIMGAFSHTRLHDLLVGSFTVKMLLNTKTPLLLLRSKDSIIYES